MKTLWIALLLLFAPTLSQAQIVAGSVKIDGASAVVQNGDNNFDVYGSFLGVNHSTDPAKTFDSCNDPSLTYSGANPATLPSVTFPGCNRKKVGKDTELTISFSDTQEFTDSRQLLAFVRVSNTVGGGTNNIPVAVQGPTNIQGSLGNYTVRIKWSEICLRAGGGMGTITSPAGPMDVCVDSGVIHNGAIQLAVGVGNSAGTDVPYPVNLKTIIFTPDPAVGLFNVSPGATSIAGTDGHSSQSPCPGSITDASGNSVPTGATDVGHYFTCDFAIWPGDRKVRIESDQGIINTLRLIDNSVATGGSGGVSVPLKSIIIYTSNSFATALPRLGKAKEISLRIPGDETTFISNTVKTEFTRNDQAVFARVASVDMAGNVTHLTGDNTILTKTECSPATSPPDPTTNLTYYVGASSCPYATVPSAVYGILDKDLQCFIATALRGTSSDYQVVALREFRRRFLNTTSLGKEFIKFYYTHGPKAAQWIDQHPQFKPVLQVGLWPFYFTARMFNTWGAWGGLVFLFSTISLAGILFYQLGHMMRRLNSLFK
ncbi:MAG: hypothetical protein M9899_08400 [Bdellovibrionaceae bacterium]|nr:hypothetical protein [Pseudobdellovibrionaceae bacterium]